MLVGTDATMALAIGAARSGGAVGIAGAGGGTAPRRMGAAAERLRPVHPDGRPDVELHDVVAMAEAGRLQLEADRVPFADTLAGYERLERGEVAGRAVVVM